MEKFSKIIHKVRHPLEIKIPPYLLDHQFEGKPVLPAVEAMQILAVSTQHLLPNTNVTCILDARFDKFLYISRDEKHIVAFNEIEAHEDGRILSKLITKSRTKKTHITRIKEHVILNFALSERKIEKRPFDNGRFSEENNFKISTERIYSELVPFGPAYHNVKNFLHFSEDGAIAKVFSSNFNSHNELPLGSPFPLDAAFHAACAWGQRFSHVVAFPIGLKERHVFHPTLAGKSYITVLIPIQRDPKLLIFDIWIYEENGDVCEGVLGVQMRDVSAGRMTPPRWIMK